MEDVNTKLSMLNLSISNTNSCVVLFHFHGNSEDKAPDLSEINTGYICDSFGNYNMESWVYDDNQIIAIFNI
jgi:hypothetical protein